MINPRRLVPGPRRHPPPVRRPSYSADPISVPLERADDFARGRVPDPRRPVRGPRRHLPPVRRPSHAVDPTSVPLELHGGARINQGPDDAVGGAHVLRAEGRGKTAGRIQPRLPVGDHSVREVPLGQPTVATRGLCCHSLFPFRRHTSRSISSPAPTSAASRREATLPRTACPPPRVEKARRGTSLRSRPSISRSPVSSQPTGTASEGRPGRSRESA